LIINTLSPDSDHASIGRREYCCRITRPKNSANWRLMALASLVLLTVMCALSEVQHMQQVVVSGGR